MPELQDELWLLTHQDIRKSWRVKAFMTFCAAAVADLKPLVEGSSHSRPEGLEPGAQAQDAGAPITARQTISISCGRWASRDTPMMLLAACGRSEP